MSCWQPCEKVITGTLEEVYCNGDEHSSPSMTQRTGTKECVAIDLSERSDLSIGKEIALQVMGSCSSALC